ncbi:hypothetical protein MMC20_007642 [Loxospora ochrophaea]|nr:hypothetical protein [Loxospora ochrophaea]
MATSGSLPRIEGINEISLASFKSQFFPDQSSSSAFTHPRDLTKYCITLELSSTITESDLNRCFNIVAETSARDYRESSVGWSPRGKRKEMRLPDLRYLLVKPVSFPQASAVEAFSSFMMTYEDGHEVVYCYEIHVSSHLRGSGLGRQLMDTMETMGKKVGVEKAMLTVFVKNEGALRFYERLGYQEDEYSPKPRKLRRGTIKTPDYVILSKRL